MHRHDHQQQQQQLNIAAFFSDKKTRAIFFSSSLLVVKDSFGSPAKVKCCDSCFRKLLKQLSLLVCTTYIQSARKITRQTFTYRQTGGVVGTLKPRYNEPRNSEFRDIVIKSELPF